MSTPVGPFSAVAFRSVEAARLHIAGELDLATVPEFKARASTLDHDLSRLTLDLSALQFADVCGLRALEEVVTTVSARATEVRVVGMSEFVRRITRLAGFRDLEDACSPPADFGGTFEEPQQENTRSVSHTHRTMLASMSTPPATPESSTDSGGVAADR